MESKMIEFFCTIGVLSCGLSFFFFVYNVMLLSFDSFKKYKNKWKRGKNDDNH